MRSRAGDPTRHTTLEAWAQDTGASLRTVARLFRTELGSTFTQWRQQVILVKAVSLAAAACPGQIATELGYSPSVQCDGAQVGGAAPGAVLGSGSGHLASLHFSKSSDQARSRRQC